MEKLQQLVQTWRVGPIAKNRKVKSRIIRAYMTRFCISKPTADNTLNGRRTTPVDPKEVEFLKKRMDTELKFLETL